jgi:hypothetical protein
MSDQDETGSVVADDADTDPQYHIEALLGELEEVRYFVSDGDHRYAVAVENVNSVQMILVYEVEPEMNLLWVFRSLDSAIWGNAMWANNENVIGTVESVRESEQAVLVTEEVDGHQVLKFLIYDVDEEDWRIFLVLHSVTDDDASGGASADSSYYSQMSSPCLSDETGSHL